MEYIAEFALIAPGMPLPDEDYDESQYPMPPISDLVNVILHNDIHFIDLVIVGKRIGSDPHAIKPFGGSSRKINTEDILHSDAVSYRKRRGSNRIEMVPSAKARDRNNTPAYLSEFMRLIVEPLHVAVIYVKKIR